MLKILIFLLKKETYFHVILFVSVFGLFMQ